MFREIEQNRQGSLPQYFCGRETGRGISYIKERKKDRVDI
ncbi:hypothetical protein CLV51_104133 [Chitinophaga niastensis]|uniref:Uncharacterized protein n=1 Tax=Chitinophaga niastensis TaxID=536980 RepID=A0A2P8HGT9_CHINA|nr:hypothetical protein CLV51_104133 [Chitinophaga niastensis]